jgi:hypothetical protein
MIAGTYTLERKPKGFRTLAISSTAKALSEATGGVPKGATRAIISVMTDAIRWRDDAGTPTASVGILGAANGLIELPSLESINGFRSIRVTTDATLNIAYYGE